MPAKGFRKCIQCRKFYSKASLQEAKGKCPHCGGVIVSNWKFATELGKLLLNNMPTTKQVKNIFDVK